MKINPNLVTLASYPPGEWVYFTDEDGRPSRDFMLLALERLGGFVESALGNQVFAGPFYHRITDKGRDFLDKHRAEAEHP